MKLTIPLPFLKKPVTTSQTTALSTQTQELAKGLTSVKDILAPSAIEVDFDFLKIGGAYTRTFFVAGYPRFVSANWLSPLISFDHTLDIAMHIYPQESREILDNLKRKVGEMEATIQSDIKRGRVIDPSVQVSLEDALELQQQLAKGAERFFQFGLYVTIPADTIDELNQVSKQVESTLASLLIIAKKATLQMEDGFRTTLPMGKDSLVITRNMDTTSLGTTFPFTTSELTANEGILYGINEHNDSLVIFDRFTLENANSVIFGKSVAAWENVLIRKQGKIKLVTIGKLVEELIVKYGITYKDSVLEGVRLPDFEVYSYNKKLQGEWTPVSIAARKSFNRREKLYQITTQSGRSITVTADHSLIVLRNGKIRPVRGEAVKIGEAVPLPRYIPEPKQIATYINPTEYVPKWSQLLPQVIPISNEFLLLLGLLTSEGLLRPHIATIYNTDYKVLEIVAQAAAKLGIQIAKRYDASHTVNGYNLQPNTWAKLFYALGAGGASGEKRVPPFLFSCGTAQIAHYLRAYFEGDGTTEEHSISATSKSKALISDLAYLLLRFGIIARIKPAFKRATNSSHQGDFYYKLNISGQRNMQLFITQIGFLTEKKQSLTAKLFTQTANTNVDTVPTLVPTFKKLYRMLYQGDNVKTPLNFSALKRGVFNPSPEQLTQLITAAENRIQNIKRLHAHISTLNHLPKLETIIARGSKNKKLNRKLWEELGASWNLMKQQQVVPKTNTVLRAYKTISGETITLAHVGRIVVELFTETGLSLQKYNKSLWAALILESRRQGDTAYPTLYEAVTTLKKRYRSLQLTMRHAEKIISDLKLLAKADLFWDPIVAIETIKHQEKYVYDLTVDNAVFLGGQGGLFVHNSGGGKSYLVKLEALRSLMFGTEVIIIDPENEYEEMCKAVNGEYITFSFNSTAKINPFDLSQLTDSGENELGLKILALHGLFRVIMGTLTPEEDAILDRAIILTYKQKGITQEPQSQKKEPPLMEDLYKVLLGMEEAVARTLADRIERFIKGSLTGIIDQHSNIDIKNQFTVFSIRDLADELRPIAMYILLDFIWTKIRRELKKRILMVDEAWYLMKYPDSAQFLNSIAKRARKYFLGLTTISQDVEDFLSIELGHAIVQNSSIQILLKQSATAIDRITELFYLSEGEKHLLLSADIGEGLFFAGPAHVAVRIIASAEEHLLITTKPEEVLKRRQLQSETEVKTNPSPPTAPQWTPPPPPQWTPPPTPISEFKPIPPVIEKPILQSRPESSPNAGPPANQQSPIITEVATQKSGPIFQTVPTENS